RSPLYDADALHAILPEPRGGEECRKPATDEQAFDSIIDGLAGLDLVSVRVDLVLRQRTREVGRVLRSAFRSVFQSQVAFLGELLLDAIIVVLRPCGLPQRVKGANGLGFWDTCRFLHARTLLYMVRSFLWFSSRHRLGHTTQWVHTSLYIALRPFDTGTRGGSPHHFYLPLYRGARFSINARGPSLASSVLIVKSAFSCSMRKPSSKETLRLRSMISLVLRTATGPLAAILRANASALGMTWSAGTTSLTRPIR